MAPIKSLQHKFVDHFPETLTDGVLYVSIPFATVTHACCCGCGEEIVTPLTPIGWKLTYDGETVSLCSSVGNWQLPCRSHYWIRANQVIWDRHASKPSTWGSRILRHLRKGLRFGSARRRT